MSEIKFRAWDKKEKRMTDHPIKIGDIEASFGEVAIEIEYDRYIKGEQNLLFMRHTGLKDKNGVEIYENDKVKVYDISNQREYLYTVFWNNQRGRFSPSKMWNLNQEVEVIGNIYQNPELI